MRKRLTSQTLFAESRKDGIFPGDIGNMERDKFYYKQDEFNNEASEFKPGWDLPEKTEIKDERDEVGFGVMKTKKARRATLLAHALLGSEATDAMIVAQGKIFFASMSDEDILASLKNWKAADELTELEEKVEEKQEEVPETVAKEAPKADEPAPKTEETVEETTETVETPENNVEEIETVKETETPKADEEELTIDIPDAPDTSEAELQITQVEPDPELEAAFMDEPYDGAPVEEEEPKASVTANKKTGISHLPQPKLTASTQMTEKEELTAIFSKLATPDQL